MSHQTGIVPNEPLTRFFAKARDASKCRLFKVVIENEQLILRDERPVQGDWKTDFALTIVGRHRMLFSRENPSVPRSHDELVWVTDKLSE
ncbi:twinfilin-2-B-like [Tropilaelaps mercedesae]|uniref:Twinfilin-2-B-like n=1 Tax=Tropilaelaps mercedesae TaxID=418985 RepID=A0A1V9XEN9_9ACAR|nr:twinfilin-2-B-like [Tropilaelaps mercedesae]